MEGQGVVVEGRRKILREADAPEEECVECEAVQSVAAIVCLTSNDTTGDEEG